MRWLISFRYAEFLNTSSLQDLITLFMDSRMPITTWRSCSVRTFSTKLGITTSSSFRSAGEEKAHKQKNYNPSCNDVCFFYMSLSATVYSFTVGPHHQTISVQKKKKKSMSITTASPWWLSSVGLSFHAWCWARQNWPIAPNAARRTSSWGYWEFKQM